MSKQDDQVDQIVSDVNAQFTSLSAAVANVAADEQNILKQLQDLQANAGELTPANLAKLQGLVTAVQGQVQTVQALADSIPDVPPPAA